MSVSVRIDPIEKDLTVWFNELLSPVARSKALADYARGALAETIETNTAISGHKPSHETFVDGSHSENIDLVRPDGTILYEFELFGELLEWIGEQLVKNSPYRSGAYERAHKLYADGIELDPGTPTPTQASEFTFINNVPYARKIERGESPQAPDGVYEAVAVLARARFGNVASIEFTYRGVVDGFPVNPLLIGASKSQRSTRGQFEKHGGSRAHNVSDVRWPAIIIKLRS